MNDHEWTIGDFSCRNVRRGGCYSYQVSLSGKPITHALGSKIMPYIGSKEADAIRNSLLALQATGTPHAAPESPFLENAARELAGYVRETTLGDHRNPEVNERMTQLVETVESLVGNAVERLANGDREMDAFCQAREIIASHFEVKAEKTSSLFPSVWKAIAAEIRKVPRK